MDKIKVNRLKNILDGNYKSATSIHSGYENQTIHREGDEWEENNRLYKIKNGIKCSIAKYSNLRKTNAMPMFCPKCNVIMNHHLDEKFWRIRGVCFECTIKEDTQLIIEGKFEEFQKQKVIENILSYLKHREGELNDFMEDFDINQFITENGDIEDWIHAGMTKEQAKETIMASYNTMKKDLLDSIKK